MSKEKIQLLITQYERQYINAEKSYNNDLSNKLEIKIKELQKMMEEI